MKTRFDGGYLIFLLDIITLTTTVYAVWTHFSPVPYADQWDGTIGFYLRALQNPWQAFFELHNEHRLIFSRLFFTLIYATSAEETCCYWSPMSYWRDFSRLYFFV